MFKRSYWCASRTHPSENLQEWTPKDVHESVKIEPSSLALKQQETGECKHVLLTIFMKNLMLLINMSRGYWCPHQRID